MKHIATITVILPNEYSAENARHELFASAVDAGFYVLTSASRPASKEEMDIYQESKLDVEENNRRDEKNGLHGEHVNDAN